MKKHNWFAPIVLPLLVLLFNSCISPQKKVLTSNYFDLKGYFEIEAARLQEANPSIRKTVFINGSSEEKQLHIENWKKEFSAFIDADINKAAWQGQFATEKKNDIEYYKAKKEEIPIQLLTIDYNKEERIRSIKISIRNKNILYTSVDELLYYPDSLYEITKSQAVRFRDVKSYKVKGVFTDTATPSQAQSSAAPLP